MCGIAGIVHTDHRPVDAEALRRMAHSLSRRGPDGRGVWTDGPAGFAHTRLAIIDLQGGEQPMRSPETGCVLTYNGEIYNYRDLRCRLKREGSVFHDASDTEVVLRAYERWGESCVEHLAGMFAFAIWDPRTRSLFAARDRLGIKPLYFRHDGTTLVFASELTAILEADSSAPRSLNPRALDAYLQLQYVPGPDTMVAGISQLQPGSRMTFRSGEGQLTSARYWRPLPGAGAPARTDDLQARVARSVTSHLVADVPVGALLSGGVDSSLVVAHMVRAAGGTIHTFSVGFDDDRLDERDAARRVSAHLGTTHHEQIVTADEAASTLPAVLSAMDQPLADYAALPTFLIARFASQHVKVVLTGEGADELFAGYRRYRRDLLLAPFERLRSPYQPSHVFSARETSSLTGRRAAPLSTGTTDLPRDGDPLNRMLVRDLEGWLPDDLLVKVDRMTMGCSLEARVPYLDHELVEYALTVPAASKLRVVSGENKVVMRKAAAAMIPPAIASRPKHGFKPPVDAWLRGPLRSLAADALLGRDAVIRQQVDRSRVNRLFSELDRGAATGHRLWTLLVHELWSRERGVA